MHAISTHLSAAQFKNPKDPLVAASLGALASVVAQCATTPLDVARTRIMSSPREGDAAYRDNIVEACQVRALMSHHR
jgi:hypothetical protein